MPGVGAGLPLRAPIPKSQCTHRQGPTVSMLVPRDELHPQDLSWKALDREAGASLLCSKGWKKFTEHLRLGLL